MASYFPAFAKATDGHSAGMTEGDYFFVERSIPALRNAVKSSCG